jgi:hypothetical protein
MSLKNMEKNQANSNMSLKNVEKNQANSNESSKPGLIFQTHNP